MAQFTQLSSALKTFIEDQKLFFVATAAPEGRVNLSPKGLDTFKVLGDNRVIWMSLTGSGNETAAHINQSNRITIMFCAFEGPPLILRLYGKANIVHPRDEEWNNLIQHFPNFRGARQVYDVRVEMVQTSCGFGVPVLNFEKDRERLVVSNAEKTEEELLAYWENKNTLSIDGYPTFILDE